MFTGVKMINKLIPCLFLLVAACQTNPVERTYEGLLDQGDKPGIAMKLTFKGEQIIRGTFSLVAPDGGEEFGGTARLDTAVQILGQDGDRFRFRVDLMSGGVMRPFFNGSRLSAQPDGTLNMTWEAVDEAGNWSSVMAPAGPPMVLSLVRE
ncbi:MAG: hypothetical protein ACI89X_003677 [Planctomycetota bacterium]|jgi:hypothetical protein